MPNVYASETRIPELDGAVRDGLAIVMHNVEDVEAVEAVCH